MKKALNRQVSDFPENEIRRVLNNHFQRKIKQNDLFYQAFAVVFSVVFSLLMWIL